MASAYSPINTEFHFDTGLTDFVAGTIQDIAMDDPVMRAIPTYMTPHRSNKYHKIDTQSWHQNRVGAKKNEFANTPMASYRKSEGSYYCEIYPLGSPVSREAIANADPALSPTQLASMYVRDQLLQHKQIDVFGRLMKAGVWNFNYTPANANQKWDNDNSKPIDVVRPIRQQMRRRTGKKWNTCIMGEVVYDALTTNDNMMSRGIQGASPDNLMDPDVAMIMRLFKVDHLIVVGTIEDTSEPDDPNALVANKNAPNSVDIVGDEMLMLHVPRGANNGNLAFTGMQPLVATAVWLFQWGAYIGNESGFYTREWYDPDSNCYKVAMESAYDVHVVDANLGAYFSDLLG